MSLLTSLKNTIDWLIDWLINFTKAAVITEFFCGRGGWISSVHLQNYGYVTNFCHAAYLIIFEFVIARDAK